MQRRVIVYPGIMGGHAPNVCKISFNDTEINTLNLNSKMGVCNAILN